MSLTPARATTPSGPVRALVAGLLLVLLDLRFDGLDVAVDSVGWVVVLLVLSRLVPLLPGSSVLMAGAALAAVLSLADVVQPMRTTTETNAFTSGNGAYESSLNTTVTAATPPDGLQGGLVTAYSVTVAVFLVALCASLAAGARRRDDEPAARSLRALTWWLALTHGLALVAGLVGVDVLAVGATLAAVVLWVLVLRSLWALGSTTAAGLADEAVPASPPGGTSGP